MESIVVAVADAWLREPVGELFVAKGQMWAADDPVVKRHPGAFRPLDGQDVRRSVPIVETATAAPGEKRQVRRSA